MRSLTDTKLRSLKPAADGKPYDVKDSQVPGLRVRVLPSGQRTFVLLGRFPGSLHPTRRALGVYDELTLEGAREKAGAWRKLIRKGIDPSVQEERDRQAVIRQQRITFAVVAEDFLRDKVLGAGCLKEIREAQEKHGKKNWRRKHQLATNPLERKGIEIERDLREEFVSVWGKRPVTEITTQDVRDVVKAAKDRGAPYQAHNLLVLARRMFAWAIDQHVYGLESSPCDRLKPKAIIGKKVFRTRTLTDDELRVFWRATGRLGYPYGPLFRMLALTGQRKSEVAEARWSEADLAKKLWTIPAERMKADAPHVVPLADDVVALLQSLPRFKKGDNVFSTTFGVKPVNGFSKAKERLDWRMLRSWRALGRVRGEDRRQARIEPWVIHDIRRTMRTGLSALPVPDLVRELVIAHTKPGLHKVYDQHAYLDEKRRALDLWALRVGNTVEPPPANVVALRA